MTLDLKAGPETDVVHDLQTFPYPFRDNEFELVHLSHVLEHLPWYDTTEVLFELRRILKPGGEIHVHVPDAEKIWKAYRGEIQIEDEWFIRNEEIDPGLWMNGRLFCGEGDRKGSQWWHRSMFDDRHLRRCLLRAGFRYVERVDPLKDLHGWINLGLKGTKV